MNARQNDLLLGSVVILVAALFLGTFLFLYPRLGDDTRPLVVHFRADEGLAPLRKGSAVLLSGALQVGKVSTVQTRVLDVDTPVGKKSELVVIVTADVSTALELYEDCVIGTDQPPVGGGGYLVIRDVGTAGRALAGAGPIVGQPPQSFATAIAQLQQRLLGPGGIVDKVDAMLDPHADHSLVAKLLTSLSDVNAMTAQLRVQLSPDDQRTLLAKFHRILDDINGMTAALRQQTNVEDQSALLAKLNVALDQLAGAMTQANGLLTDARPQLHETLASVQSISRTLDQDVLGKLKGEFDRGNAGSLISKLHMSMDALQGSLLNVQSMTESGRVLIASNRPALQKTIDNVKEASDAMRVGMQELIVAPWKLLDKPTGEADRRRIEIFDAARRFAEAAAQLDNAAVRLESVMAAAPADGPITARDEELAAIRDAIRGAFERFQSAEEFLFERLK